MTNWSGTRSGFNTRGGTPNQQLRNQIEYQEDQDHINDPNSAYWEMLADLTHRKLKELLQSDYELWAEVTWHGDSLEQKTYREIYERMAWALNNPKITFQEIECSCNGVTTLCDVCKAREIIREKACTLCER